MTQKAERRPSIYYLLQEGVIECRVLRSGKGGTRDVDITFPPSLKIIHSNAPDGTLYISYRDGWNKTKITTAILPKSSFE